MEVMNIFKVAIQVLKKVWLNEECLNHLNLSQLLVFLEDDGLVLLDNIR